jgi:membrane AbrB-like protein
MHELSVGRTALVEWIILIILSAVLFAAMQLLHMPAALLLASMLSGIATSSRNFSIRVPRQPFLLAQGLIGCLMAQSLQPKMLQRVMHDWPLFLGFTVLIMGASAALGWWLARHKVLPGTTAVWGLAPGAASAMVLMSESYGADSRLVAFIQYTRVVIVTCIAALVARLWLGESPAGASTTAWWLLQSTSDVGWTLALVAAGLLISKALRFPTGAMLLPLVLGVLLQSLGWFVIELPPLLLALAYMLIGWSIGLRYTPATLNHAWRALPRVLLSIAALIALGMLLATALALLGRFDPLTAYLATSPGGADSVAIIAAHAATVDAGFVMAMQVGRFMLVFLFGPRVSRWVAQHT